MSLKVPFIKFNRAGEGYSHKLNTTALSYKKI